MNVAIVTQLVTQLARSWWARVGYLGSAAGSSSIMSDSGGVFAIVALDGFHLAGSG